MINPWRDIKGLPRESWLMFVAVLVNRMGTMVVPFLTLYVIDALKGTEYQAGLVLLAYGLGGFITAPLAGRLSDRIGAITTMRFSLLGTGLLLLSLSLFSGLWLFALVSFCTAVVNEAFRPASMVYVSQVAPPDKKRQSFALNRLAINLGMSIGPAAGGLLATIHFPAIFWVDGATSLLAFALLFLLPARDGGAPTQQKQPPMREALSDRRLLIFLFAMLPAIFAFLQHAGPVPLFMVKELGLSTYEFGLTVTVNTVMIIFLEVPLASWLSKSPNHYSLSAGSLLIGVGMGILIFVDGLWGCVISIVVLTFGEMLLFPALSVRITEIAPKERQGEYMGYYSMAWALAFLVGPPAGTFLYSLIGGDVLWMMMLALGVTSTVIFWLSPAPQDEP